MIRRVGLASLILAGTSACGFVPSEGAAPVYALIVVNGAADEATVIIGGTRLPNQPCSAHVEPVPPGTGWKLVIGGEVVLADDHPSLIIGAPVTVVEIVIRPDGSAESSDPAPAAAMPDAPLAFECA